MSEISYEMQADGGDIYKEQSGSDQDSIESIDIDEFLIRSGECGRYQFYIIVKMMLITFPLSYVALIFYFIGYDPHWKDSKGRMHLRDNNRRCKMNRSEWTYDYAKTTMTTEYDLICGESWKLSLIGSVVFIGWAAGSLVLGFLSDRYGRKALMLPCFFIDMFCLFLHGFVKSLWALIFIRLVMGFFHAAPATNSFVLIIELVGPNYRVLASNVGGVVWGIASAVLALLAFLIDDWRNLSIAASAPFFIFIAIGFWFPESIRWQNANGRSDRAEKTLHRAAEINKRPVKNVKLKEANREAGQNPYSMCFGMVYYTISWAFADIGGNLYINFILGFLVELPMHAVCIICLQRYGRKRTVWVSLITAAIASLLVIGLILVGNLEALRLVVGLIAKAMISLAFMSIYMWSAEIFPTVVRTQGLGITIVTSRLGAAISPFVNNLDLVHPTLPFVVIMLALVSSCLCSFYLPETLNKPTREKFEDLSRDD